MTGDVIDTVFLELFVMDVLSLGESIGKEEKGGSRRQDGTLFREPPVGCNTNGNIRIAIEKGLLLFVCNQQGCIVAGIAILEVACGEVKNTDEKCDKHV